MPNGTNTTFGDKKSHYTALLVGVFIGTLSSSIVLLAVALSASLNLSL